MCDQTFLAKLGNVKLIDASTSKSLAITEIGEKIYLLFFNTYVFYDFGDNRMFESCLPW